MVLASIVEQTNAILDEIIDEHLDLFEEEGNLKVVTKYGQKEYFLDQIDEAEDMCLQGLVHYILYEEGLYSRFLNDQQMQQMENMLRESPYYIYSPNPESNEGSHEEIMADIKSRDMIEAIHHRAIIFVAERLIEEGFDVPELEEYLAEAEED